MKRIWTFALLAIFALDAVALDEVLPLRSWRLNLEFMSLDGDAYFDHNEQRLGLDETTPAQEYTSDRFRLRSEYGMRRHLTMITELEFLSREYTGLTNDIKTDGISRGYLGVRQNLGQPGRAIRFTAEYGVWVPIEADANEPLPIGNDSLDWQVFTGYAQDFFPTRGGFEMDFGYRFRAENPEDEIFFDTELFFQLFKFGEIKLDFHVIESQTNTGRTFSRLEYPDNRAEQKFGITYSHTISTRLIVKLGYRSLRDGRNVFETDGWFVALEWWR